MKMSTLAQKPRWSALVAIGAALVALAASTQTALTKTITFNNGSGSGLWNFTDNNWTANPYVDGDTATFDTAVWAGPVNIVGNVAPASLIIKGSGWVSGTPSGTPITFSDGDIVGAGTISVNQDKAGVFTQDNLSFSGGTFLTANAATIRFNPPSAGPHWFGTGPITLSHNSVTFQFNPGTAGASLGNGFVISSGINSTWQNISASNGGTFTGTLTVNAGGALTLGTGTLSMPTVLKGNTTFNVCANGGGTGYIVSGISSDGGPYNLVLQSSGNGDHKTQLSGSLPWNVANVERKVSASGQWGTVFIANQDVLFSQLAANNGAFIQTSGTTAFGTPAAVNLNPVISFPLTVTGGGFFGASTVNLNLVSGGVLGGAGALLRTASFSTANFNASMNVNLNPGGTLALSGGSIGSASVVSTLSANGGTASGANGNATVYGTTTVNSGATTFSLPNSSLFTGAALARTAGATALFRGANLGSTAKATFTSGTGMTGGILPWARAATSDNGAGETFAAYDAANGFVPLASYDATDDLSVSGNVDLTAVNTIASGDPDRTVNALRLSSGGGVSIDSARTLTVTSGGILALDGNAGIAGGTLAFGSAEGILHTLGDLAISSAVTGSAGLTKDGAGGLTLSGANSLGSGATAINAGWLTLGSGSAIGSGTLTVQPEAVLDVAGYSPTVGGIRDNAGQAAGGTVTNSGAAATLTINTAGAQTFSGRLIGEMSLVKNGNGTQTLSGDNAYPGGTTLNAGTLAAGHDNAFGTGGLTLAGGTLQGANGARTLTNAVTVSGNFTVAGSSALTLTQPIALTGNRIVTVSNTGGTTFAGGLSEDSAGRALAKAGTGVLILPVASAYSGATTITDGALRADDGASLPSASLLIFNGGNNAVLETSGTFTRTVGTAAGNVQWTGHGGFAAYGAPLAVRLNDGSAGVTWNSGSFVPNAKYLNLGSTTADNVVTFENAINLNNGNRVINVVDNASTTADYAVISGNITNGSVTKANTGTLRLSGVNTYAGGTYFSGTVNANGVVEVTSDSSIGTGPIYIGYGHTATIRNVAPGAVTLPGKMTQTGGGSQSLILGGNDFNMTGDIQFNNGQGNITVQSGTKAVFSGSILSTGINVNGPGTLEFTGANSGGIRQLSGFAKVGMGTDFGAEQTRLNGQSSITLYAIGGPRTFSNPIALQGYGDNTLYFTGTNAIAFTGTITDESGGSNRGYNLNTAADVSVTFASAMPGNRGNSNNYYTKSGLGLLVFSGINSYTFRTFLAGGVLRAKDGVGLPTTSYLRLDGGVLECDGTFNRTLAAHPANTANGDSQFRWNGNGGFSAFGGPLTVDINGGGADTFTWGSTANFLGSAHTLVLGSTNANDVVTLVDHINLNAANRTVQVNDNPATDADYAVLAGNLTGTGASALTKSGSGTLLLNGVNTYPGATTVTAGGLGGSGSLAGNLVFNAGTRFRAVVGQPLAVNGLTIGANCTLDVTNAGAGTVLTYTGALSGTFENVSGAGGRIVSYATPGQIKLLSPGTVLLLK